MQFSLKFNISMAATITAVLLMGTSAEITAQSPDTSTKTSNGASSSRRSSLPDEALQKAREAETDLAANQPDKAIVTLREIDKQYPGQSAISLRLAQIYDTLNRSGYALFYYRRYIQLAGPAAREMAVERVSTLELMAGVNGEAEKVAKELGEKTRAVATPAPKYEHTLSTKAKDGTMVPIRNEEDFKRIQQRGVPATAPSTPIPTPKPAIIIPPQLTEQKEAPVSHNVPTSPSNIEALANSGTPDSTPRPDQDALLAQAFSKSDSPASIKPSDATEKKPDPTPRQKKLKITSAESQAMPQSRPVRAAPVSPRFTPAMPLATPDAIPIAQETPTFSSPRAANFFNVTAAPGSVAQIALVNDMEKAVVTLSITPKDDSEVVSGILMPGETKTLFVKPGTYNVSANVSTTDYSPITLMNTEFDYSFSKSRQYTHRFNQSSVQQLN